MGGRRTTRGEVWLTVTRHRSGTLPPPSSVASMTQHILGNTRVLFFTEAGHVRQINLVHLRWKLLFTSDSSFKFITVVVGGSKETEVLILSSNLIVINFATKLCKGTGRWWCALGADSACAAESSRNDGGPPDSGNGGGLSDLFTRP